MIWVSSLTHVTGEEARRCSGPSGVLNDSTLSPSWFHHLLSWNERILENGLCWIPGRARVLCFSLVLLWCPEDKGGEKNFFFEKLQMLCERFQAETPGSYSISSLEKLLFSFPDLRVKATLKSKSLSNSLDCQDFGGTRTFIHCCWECKMLHCLWKAIWRHLWMLYKCMQPLAQKSFFWEFIIWVHLHTYKLQHCLC